MCLYICMCVHMYVSIYVPGKYTASNTSKKVCGILYQHTQFVDKRRKRPSASAEERLVDTILSSLHPSTSVERAPRQAPRTNRETKMG